MTTRSAAGQPGRDQLVPLAGAMNFRDLGGYRTADGPMVQWGCVFRSDALDQLTDADIEVLAGLGLRLVCDLRNDREITDRAQPPPRAPRAATAAVPHRRRHRRDHLDPRAHPRWGDPRFDRAAVR